jgi:pimeloyl-ACP methyl ester carboxylesterase
MVKLVLLPGLDGTGKLRADFMRALDATVDPQLVTYPVDRVLGYDALESLVRAALPREESYVLLGESFSGPIAIRIAASPPVGLVGLILCATFAENPHPKIGWARHVVSRVPLKSLPRWLRAPLLWGSAHAQHAPAQAARATAGVDARVLQHRLAEVFRVNVSTELPHIRMPALVIEASEDRLVPRRAAAQLVRGLSMCRHVVVEGPHFLLQSRPEACAAAVTQFLNSI